MESGMNWPEHFAELKRYHDEAYHVIEQAIKLEEEGKQEEAISKYNEGLVLIDKALNVNIQCPPNADITWEKATVMVQKIRKTRKEILCRIADTQTTSQPAVPPPPSYEEAVSSSGASSQSNSLVLHTYRDLGVALQQLKVETGADTAEILFKHDSVQIYFISPDGNVTAPSQPDTLIIAELKDETTEKSRAYLQVGDWVYPLVPGVSPCFRTEYGAFILPDVHSPLEGAAVGIVLPEDADASVYELLNDILNGIVSQVAPRPAARITTRARRDIDGYGYSISRGLVSGAQYISQGLIKGAEKAGDLLNYTTPKLMEKINPEPTPRPVNPKVTQGLQVAKNVTGTAVNVTSYVASKIGCATMALGRYLAPHIQKQGTRLLSRTCNLSEQEASQKVDSVLEVAAGAVEGFSTVYAGLEKSAGLLGRSLANNTVKIVEHKYGPQYGQATGDTLYTVGNVFVAGNNIRYLTPKGLAKVTAKSAGKAVVEDYRANLRGNESNNFNRFGPGTSSEVD